MSHFERLLTIYRVHLKSEKRLDESTIKPRVRCVELCLNWVMTTNDRSKLDQVSASDILAFLEKKRGEVSCNTWNGYVRSLQQFLHLGVDLGIVRQSQIPDLQTRVVKKKSNINFGRLKTISEFVRGIDNRIEEMSCREVEIFLVIKLIYYLGFFWREIVPIKVSDVNLDRRQIVLYARGITLQVPQKAMPLLNKLLKSKLKQQPSCPFLFAGPRGWSPESRRARLCFLINKLGTKSGLLLTPRLIRYAGVYEKRLFVQHKAISSYGNIRYLKLPVGLPDKSAYLMEEHRKAHPRR